MKQIKIENCGNILLVDYTTEKDDCNRDFIEVQNIEALKINTEWEDKKQCLTYYHNHIQCLVEDAVKEENYNLRCYV
jgi:hypothetical protein